MPPPPLLAPRDGRQALIFALGSLAASTPYLAIILGLVIFLWIRSARVLNVMFNEAMVSDGQGGGQAAAA